MLTRGSNCLHACCTSLRIACVCARVLTLLVFLDLFDSGSYRLTMELLCDRDPSRYGMKTVVHAKIDSHQPRISHPEHEVVPVRSAHVRHHLKPAISVQLLPHPLPHLALHKAMVPQIDHTQSAEASRCQSERGHNGAWTHFINAPP